MEEARTLGVKVEDWADSEMEKEARVSGRSQGRNGCAERGHHFPSRRIPGGLRVKSSLGLGFK